MSLKTIETQSTQTATKPELTPAGNVKVSVAEMIETIADDIRSYCEYHADPLLEEPAISDEHVEIIASFIAFKRVQRRTAEKLKQLAPDVVLPLMDLAAIVQSNPETSNRMKLSNTGASIQINFRKKSPKPGDDEELDELNGALEVERINLATERGEELDEAKRNLKAAEAELTKAQRELGALLESDETARLREEIKTLSDLLTEKIPELSVYY